MPGIWPPAPPAGAAPNRLMLCGGRCPCATAGGTALTLTNTTATAVGTLTPVRMKTSCRADGRHAPLSFASLARRCRAKPCSLPESGRGRRIAAENLDVVGGFRVIDRVAEGNTSDPNVRRGELQQAQAILFLLGALVVVRHQRAVAPQ